MSGPYDLLLIGGTVISPATGIHQLMDVGVVGDRITEIAPGLTQESAKKVLDVHGDYVTPGLIDFHVHSYWGVNPYGFNADPICLASGVTTAVDAGSSGAVNFLGFRKLVHEQSRARMLAFVALAQHGVLNDPGELENLTLLIPMARRKALAMRATSASGSRFGFTKKPSATTAGKRCEWRFELAKLVKLR